MRLSKTLSVYIGGNFLAGFAGVFTMLMFLILIMDTLELMRRAAGVSIPFGSILEMALLKLPQMGQETFPFAALFGGMIVFWRLTRNRELMVTRAAGVSAWQFLLPVLIIVLMLGVLRITVVDPLASTLLSRFQHLEATLLKGQKHSLSLSGQALWLRQASDDGQAVVHAARVVHRGDEVQLYDVIIFAYDDDDQFVERIDASTGTLEDRAWHLRDVWALKPDKPARFMPALRLPTDLTLSKIQDSFASPETMSFWELPSFIETLRQAGFSAVRHRLHFHAMLAGPLFMCAMVLIAATFTLKPARRGGALFIVAGGLITGFVVYLFADVVFAMGLSDSIPVVLAAWAPSGVATLLGLAMLLHLEDG